MNIHLKGHGASWKKRVAEHRMVLVALRLETWPGKDSNYVLSRSVQPALAKRNSPDLLTSGTFLAHLSRRLKGELIVYRSIRRPCVSASVRPSVGKHFQTRISPQPVGQS